MIAYIRSSLISISNEEKSKFLQTIRFVLLDHKEFRISTNEAAQVVRELSLRIAEDMEIDSIRILSTEDSTLISRLTTLLL